MQLRSCTLQEVHSLPFTIEAFLVYRLRKRGWREVVRG